MKKGSALLIVLGMMAFMVVSAVAFSMYMRQSRLPSSFLRQRLAASQLVKAGLACAMQRLDAAIGESPYPGVGDLSNREVEFRRNDRTYMTTTYGNYWQNRVFVESRTAVDSIADNDTEGLTFDPVSTLSLEGLAYLPPSLINTVRYLSKRVSTASWASLGYDAGRYAFTAVNVSDFPDITRIPANAMRTSAPGGRLSLGYLFENAQHTGAGTISPATFDAFVSKSTNDAFRTGFVSLADFNLAVGSGVYGDAGFRSPFYNYIKNPPSDGSFYGSRKEDAKAMRFVTDSWFPGSLTNGTAVALTDFNEGQPFSGMENASLDDLQAINGSQAFKIMRERLDLCSLAALYDYLDGDESRGGRIPISLAIPTLERTPMLTGLCVEALDVELKVKGKANHVNDPNPNITKTRYTYSIDSFGDGPKLVISACGAYPFKRKYAQAGTSYKFQVMVRGFFSEKAIENTRLSGNVPALADFVKANWQKENYDRSKGYFTLVGEKQITVQDGPLDESQTTFDVTGIELQLDSVLAGAKSPVYGVLKTEEKDPNTGAFSVKSVEFDQTEMPATACLRYFKGEGDQPSQDFGKEGPKLVLNYCICARILDDNGDTVDLVPAVVADDKVYLGKNNEGGNATDMKKICGDGRPVIPIHSDVLTKLDWATFEPAAKNGKLDVEQVPGAAQGKVAIYCDDPRFNYAPEDWYTSQNGDVHSTDWLTAAKGRCTGGNRRPHDIFMAVSDAGYDRLQSMGELQFLPYLRSFGDRRDPFAGTFYNSGKYNGKPFADRTAPTACVNRDFAWTSHWAFGDYDDARDGSDADPTKWGILDSIGGVKVNPYAEESMMMAAFANTPYDWAVAAGDTGMTLDNGRPYCFGPSSTEAKMEWDDLLDIANHIKTKIGARTDWERVWNDELDWDTENFLGSELDRSKLHDVDRKFLYSYWRSCFGNDQQLFLIFVRAEPSVMGGSSAGHTPAQLGARAVALVWREPKSSVRDTQNLNGTTSHPHRMRILFYRQFE